MEKKLKITTPKQFQILVTELERNPSLVNGSNRATTPKNKQVWEEIVIKLNTFGPPVRDADGWLKVWRDFKFKVKRKATRAAEKDAYGRKKYKHIMLHPLEEAVANLLQFQTQPPDSIEIKTEKVDVWEDEEDFSLGNQSFEDEIKTENYSMEEQSFLVDEEQLPSTSLNSVGMEKTGAPGRRKRKRNHNSDERHELLEKHNAMQEEVFNEIAHTMNEIKNILNNSSRYQQKLLEIETKKLEILKRRNDRDEQLFESEMKLKMLEMKLKTKELEALGNKSMQ